MFMGRFLQPVFFSGFRKQNPGSLAFVWLTGLILGGMAFRYAGSDLVSQMPLAVQSQPSIFGLLASCLLPFLFSAFAVYLHAPRLLYGICFLKAFIFAYISWGVMGAFGGSGWLLRGLLLFSDLWGAAVLFFYCQRHISGLRGFSFCAFGIYVCMLVLVSGVDHSFISPLLRRLLS
jgi:hypothetical protein